MRCVSWWRLVITGIFLTLCTTAPVTAATDVQVEQRADALLEQMTLEEKIDLLAGTNIFDHAGLPRLHIPQMVMGDGPFGVRAGIRTNVTAGGIGLASTWNVDLAQRVGTEFGRDARARGVYFHLAPGANIYRSPLNGRNFEYLGEDPLLASKIAVALIRGTQSQGVASTIKHYLANDSEFARHTTDAAIDERTLREIYMPPFEAAVTQGHVGAVMNSYNLLNGEHATQSRWLNVDVLKHDWGFDGVLMSDWDATYDTLGAVNGGLDLEMPFGKFLNRQSLLPLVRSGQVSEKTLDDKIRRFLRLAVRLGWMDREQRDPLIPLYNPQGRQAALQAAREGIVLLKNEGSLLPLDRHRIKRIAVIGPNAHPPVAIGGGSVTVVPFAATSVLQGLTDLLGTDVDLLYARGIQSLARMAARTAFTTAPEGGKGGLTAERFANEDLSGTPQTRIDAAINQGSPLDLTPLASGDADLDLAVVATAPQPTSTRWTGYFKPTKAGPHDLFVQLGGNSQPGYRVYVDGRLVFDRWRRITAALDQTTLQLDARSYKIVVEHHALSGGFSGAPLVRVGIVPEQSWVEDDVAKLAAAADAVVVSVGFNFETEMEDWDRSFRLPPGQDELIRRVSEANPQTIVVINSGGAVDMTRWRDHVAGLLQAWYPGEEGGQALAEILFGDVNPSGHLPVTFEQRLQDNPTYAHYYPAAGTDHVEYKEGVFVGYRGYEHSHVRPAFAFGGGLSYTSFHYSHLKVQPRARGEYEVSFDVTNTGARTGAEVAQVYVGQEHPRVPRPPKELKGFSKITLQPGETRSVIVPLDLRAFAYYEVGTRQWRADADSYQVSVGGASDRIEATGTLQLKHMQRIPVSGRAP